MRKPRLLASLLCTVLMVGVLTVPAYAGGGDESEDGVGEYVPWEGLEPAEPLPTEPNPFTPDGTGTVVDNATDQDGKEFFTITTAEEAVFYLVIDRQRETENVYFLNAVTVADLMALAESSGEPAAPEPTPEPDPEPDPTPEPVPEKKGGAGPLLLALAVVVIGGGAGWYFKIYRPKHQKAAEPEEDYGGDPYDGPEDYDGEAPWDEDDGEPEE
ncbi:DUF4366 domain-containing protein [uncultured Oscillibacter sp.]|uniref:DUF4366 domain-containing protein n=1 Tax=uncultured Oscillibacter sp. TaxID=876091 RepID=UPI00272DA5CA|nr:DUF4366 domain-containing protein [uncultured Oscillibacter sp.]